MAKKSTGTKPPKPKQPRADTSFSFGANAKPKKKGGGFKNSGGG